MLNNPAVVPEIEANGRVKEIDGVLVALVTVEVNVLPEALTIIGLTLDTVPPLPVADIVIEPLPLRIETPDPAVKVDFVKVFPTVLPISNSPLINEDCPVPPLAVGITPVI